MSQMFFPMESADDGRGPEFLTIAEAADRVRVCERTVRRAIDSGNLRAARVRGSHAERGSWRIRTTDLERWLFGEPES